MALRILQVFQNCGAAFLKRFVGKRKADAPVLDVIFFGDFSESSGIRDELNHIRRFTNHVVETANIGPHAKASFTDFIMLDNIYQKVISSPEIEQIVLFTGDSDFCSVASYLRLLDGNIPVLKIYKGHSFRQLDGGLCQVAGRWLFQRCTVYCNAQFRQCRFNGAVMFFAQVSHPHQAALLRMAEPSFIY